jgi:UDP-N-acetylmuramate dehydrogenase
VSLDDLARALGPAASLRAGEPLARHTALRTGGPCDAWAVVHREEALGPLLAGLRDLGLAWQALGAGTRTVVRDGGVAGAVIRLGGELARVRVHGEGDVEAGAGAPVAALVAATAGAGHLELAPLTRVAGSVGASVLLDEWRGVTAVRWWHRGQVHEGPVTEARAAGPKAIVLGVRLRLEPGLPGEAWRRVRVALGQPQPLAYEPPRGDQLRDLLDRVALGGVRLREVGIPAAAPELLVNLGRGTARDLDLLHRSARERVRARCGVELTSRIRWAGRAA